MDRVRAGALASDTGPGRDRTTRWRWKWNAGLGRPGELVVVSRNRYRWTASSCSVSGTSIGCVDRRESPALKSLEMRSLPFDERRQRASARDAAVAPVSVARIIHLVEQ
jgi:hypothetical protein